MTTTYYEYTANYSASVDAPSGVFTKVGGGGESITIDSSSPPYGFAGGTSRSGINISGEGKADFALQFIFVQAGNRFLQRVGTPFRPTAIFDVDGLDGVTGVGAESEVTTGRYLTAAIDEQVFTPAKDDYEFSPPNFTFDAALGDLAYVTFTSTLIVDRQVLLSSPANTVTGVMLQPLLQWSIGGDGATEGDLLDVYLRKDDSSFDGGDQLGFLVDATLNSSWQIVGGLEYNSTYYWQVQAAASEEDDLISSEVWSFTTTTFRPPAVPTGGNGEPIGINNMLTRKRFIAAANNKIWYEDI